MTNTIDPISYNAAIEAAALRRWIEEAAITGAVVCDMEGQPELGTKVSQAIRSLHLPEPQTAPADAERLASEPQYVEWTDTEVIFGPVRLPRTVPEAIDPTGKSTVEKAVHAFVQSFGPNWRSVPLWIKAEIARAIAAAAVPFSDDYNAAQNAAEHWMAKAHDLDASLRAGGWREDMENAPRDGTRILSWWDGQHIITYWAERIGFKGWQAPAMMTVRAHDKSAWQPTHWMPLPSAPAHRQK